MPASDRGINPGAAVRLRELWCRILFLLRIRRVEHDIEQEFAAHLEIAAEVHQRNGMTAEEARRAAALAFGSRVVTKELVS